MNTPYFTKNRLFGFQGNQENMLASHYLVEKYRPLVIALLQNDQTALREIGHYLRECIEQQANEWLAEADNDELEREGLL